MSSLLYIWSYVAGAYENRSDHSLGSCIMSCMIVPHDCTDGSLICSLVFDRRSRKYYAAGNVNQLMIGFVLCPKTLVPLCMFYMFFPIV